MRYYGYACCISAIIFVVVYGALCSPCQARPHSDNAKVSAWIEDMSGWVPLSSVEVEIKVGFCPWLDPAKASGCYRSDQRVAWIAPDDLTKMNVAHEIGHAFDDELLGAGARNKIMMRFFRLFGTIWAPLEGAEALDACPGKDICSNEMFADGFSACARHVDPIYMKEYGGWIPVGNYELTWSKFLQKNLCRLIDKVGGSYET